MAAVATRRFQMGREEDDEEEEGCCSEDEVLSVGNEAENISFRSIESHLNAISQMVEQEQHEKSPCSPSGSSQSPTPSYTYGSPSNSPFCNSSNSNDTTPPSNLKFSIDNILKADFGRRITEPINIRRSRPPSGGKAEAAAAAATGKPVDLSKPEAGVAAPAGNKEQQGGAGGGQQPMLWPAWVYCTRYSDRPSSGG